MSIQATDFNPRIHLAIQVFKALALNFLQSDLDPHKEIPNRVIEIFINKELLIKDNNYQLIKFAMQMAAFKNLRNLHGEEGLEDIYQVHNSLNKHSIIMQIAVVVLTWQSITETSANNAFAMKSAIVISNIWHSSYLLDNQIGGPSSEYESIIIKLCISALVVSVAFVINNLMSQRQQMEEILLKIED